MSGKLTNTSAVGCDLPTVGGQHGLLLGQESIDGGNLWHRLESNVTGTWWENDRKHWSWLCQQDWWKGYQNSTSCWLDNKRLVHFKTTFSAASWTATRPIPTKSTSTTSKPNNGGKKKAGAIAGGVIGGLVLLIGVIIFTCFCLRSRRRRQNAHAQPDAQPTSQYDQGHNVGVDKSMAQYSVSQGSTLHSPHRESLAYASNHSPDPRSDLRTSSNYQGSPPYHYSGTEWSQPESPEFRPAPGDYIYQQTYYPPPPDPSQSPRSAYTLSAELPRVKSPANPTELPYPRSPEPVRGQM